MENEIRLSTREQQIFDCVANGLSNREIGHTLGLQESTVKVYTHRVADKIGLKNRRQWPLLAVKKRIAELESENASLRLKLNGNSLNGLAGLSKTLNS